MIRTFEDTDFAQLEMLHSANELDPRCFPNLVITSPDGQPMPNPLFIVKSVYEVDGKPALMCFLKCTAEIYFFIDHSIGTPEERWEWLKEFKEYIKIEGWKKGLEQITAFVPTNIEASFEKRLDDMGFVKSPWQSYTLNLED